ncbi:MAG: glycosyltransferase family 4 protein [bacterium]|nr:glycosyltransferase family 4 protein [bacterium]MDD5356501.1 glycosyltransferase family 4 protein [Candidatus Omnitrophota bacterium]
MELNVSNVLYFIASWLCGMGMAVVIAHNGEKMGLVDYPNDRSSHDQPIPKGAGSGIALGFLVTALLINMNILFCLPAMLIGLLGMISDRREIAPGKRLVFQLLLALLFMTNFNAWPANFTLTIMLFLLLSVYIVGTTNIYNFMDGINGIAAITGIISFSFLGYFAWSKGADDKLLLILYSVVVACLGFLPFNFPRAKVFMGDVGSTFLGFLFAGMVTYLTRDISDFIVLVSFLFPFYADELTTMFVRFKDRENITKAHRRHLYQLLVNEGQMAHWKVTLAYGVLQVAVSLIALRLQRYGGVTLIIVLLTLFGVFTAASIFIRFKLTATRANDAKERS